MILCYLALKMPAKSEDYKVIAGFIVVSEDYYNEYYGIEEADDEETEVPTTVEMVTTSTTTTRRPSTAPTPAYNAETTEGADPATTRCTEEFCNLTVRKLRDTNDTDGHSNATNKEAMVRGFDKEIGALALVENSFVKTTTTTSKPQVTDDITGSSKKDAKSGENSTDKPEVKTTTLETSDDVEESDVTTLSFPVLFPLNEEEKDSNVDEADGNENKHPHGDATKKKISLQARYGKEIGVGLGLIIGIGASLMVATAVILVGEHEHKKEKRRRQARHQPVINQRPEPEAEDDVEEFYSSSEGDGLAEEVAAGHQSEDNAEENLDRIELAEQV